MAALCVLSAINLRAQGPQSEEERLKSLYEAVDKEIERQTTSLDLEDWQIFRIDSTLTHDYQAMTDELLSLQKSKVGNSSAYQDVQDKWSEAIYRSYERILNKEQWEKYLKNGALRAKKARDKRAEKNKQSGK